MSKSEHDPDPIGCGCLTVVFILGVITGASKLPDFLRSIATLLEP